MLPGYDTVLESKTRLVKRDNRSNACSRPVPFYQYPLHFHCHCGEVPRASRDNAKIPEGEGLSSDIVTWHPRDLIKSLRP